MTLRQALSVLITAVDANAEAGGVETSASMAESIRLLRTIAQSLAIANGGSALTAVE